MHMHSLEMVMTDTAKFGAVGSRHGRNFKRQGSLIRVLNPGLQVCK